MKGVFTDLTGMRFGRLVVKNQAKHSGRGAKWDCVCDCGNQSKKPITTNSLLQLKTQSCGCLMVERVKASNSTHRLTKSPTYICWRLMWQRCTNPNHKSYHAYKNFTPCDRWKSFENFFEDMGFRPDGLTLDRIDNTKGYSPDNCRWADVFTQQGNTKRNIYVEIDGEIMCVKAACRKLGTNYARAKSRIWKGWAPIDAITKKSRYELIADKKQESAK